jgi:hypothetical protein
MASPYLAVRPAERGWEIVCQPGPLDLMFRGLARNNGGDFSRREQIDGHTMIVVPMTAGLDTALVTLIDALINLRYETGQVQLELFSSEDIR